MDVLPWVLTGVLTYFRLCFMIDLLAIYVLVY